MNNAHIPLTNFNRAAPNDSLKRAASFHELMKTRRSVRDFSDEAILPEIIDQCIQTAGTAPSGANQQPWHFVVIRDTGVKRQIRKAAEEEEVEFYAGRAGDIWLDTLKPLGTNAEKPFLDQAPALIAIFEQKYHVNDQGNQIKHYYSKESTGIATGLLITALHNAGLVTLTHTPSPMNFLTKILKRPSGERPFLLLVVGLPAAGAMVPDITKKSLSDIRTNI